MLNVKTIEAASTLQPLMDGENTVLKAVGDTPLRELVQMTTRLGHVPSDGADVDDILMSSDLGEISRKRNPLGVPEHDLTMDEIAPIVAEAIGAALSIARNQVNPMIKRVVHWVEQQLDQDGSASILPLVIDPQFTHRVWRNPALGELVDRYEETLQPSPHVRTRNLNITDLDRTVATKTGILDLDDDMAALIEGMGDTEMAELWHRYFQGGAESGLNQTLDIDAAMSPYSLIVVHMWTVYLSANVPDTEDIELEDFREYIAVLRAATGRLIARRIGMLDKAIRAKRMVIRYPSEEQIRSLENEGGEIRLIVNQQVYKRWLEDGGSPEILLGAALSDRNSHYDSLLANAEQYKRTWASHERLLRLAQRNKTFNRLQNYIGLAVGREINDLDLDTVPHTREQMHADLTVHVGHLCATDVENLYDTVRHILCNTIYKHTDTLRILTEFDRLAEARDGTGDMRELATLVAINYATDWVAEMIVRDRQVEAS